MNDIPENQNGDGKGPVAKAARAPTFQRPKCFAYSMRIVRPRSRRDIVIHIIPGIYSAPWLRFIICKLPQIWGLCNLRVMIPGSEPFS